MASELVLKDKPTLKDIQAYIAATAIERGFDKESAQNCFILLTEEVGELAKALRKHAGVRLATDSKPMDVEFEIADVFLTLVSLCNTLGIDLEKVLRAKEEKNKIRVWI
jgi:NTP pyrophosphatase (non-canonical NTP hydrolase)